MKTSRRVQRTVWGSMLIIFGILGLIATYIDMTAWTWVIILGASGAAALVFYATRPGQFALLLPTYVLWAIAGLVALLDLEVLVGEYVAFYVLTAIAAPFAAVFVLDRRQWWALIPAYVLMAVAIMVAPLEGVLTGRWVPAYVLFAIAIPFLFVFLRDVTQWWALIPGGILAAIGLAFVIAETAIEYILPVALILIGFGLLARQLLPEASEEPPPQVGKPPAA